jgi:hypothetical protein
MVIKNILYDASIFVLLTLVITIDFNEVFLMSSNNLFIYLIRILKILVQTI